MEALVYSDASFKDIGLIRSYALDMEYGPNSDNSFELKLDLDRRIPIGGGSLVYIEGTDFGGIVDEVGCDTEPARKKAIYRGRTWYGMLDKKVLCPDEGQSYLMIDQEANAALHFLVLRLGLGDLFSASMQDSGIYITYRFARFASAYVGICEMLASANAKLQLAWKGDRAVLSAVPVVDYAQEHELDSDRLTFKVNEVYRPVNHLVCLGKGELQNRVVAHLYTNVRGIVSQIQTQFGAAEISAIFEDDTAERSDLIEKGTEKLKEYQSESTCDANLGSGYDYDIGDIVAARNNDIGIFVSAVLSRKSITVDKRGTKFSYAIGEPASRSTTFS